MQQSSCDYVAKTEPKQGGQWVRNSVNRPVERGPSLSVMHDSGYILIPIPIPIPISEKSKSLIPVSIPAPIPVPFGFVDSDSDSSKKTE